MLRGAATIIQSHMREHLHANAIFQSAHATGALSSTARRTIMRLYIDNNAGVSAIKRIQRGWRKKARCAPAPTRPPTPDHSLAPAELGVRAQSVVDLPPGLPAAPPSNEQAATQQQP